MDESKFKKLQIAREALKDIFEQAKAKDEFEYGCALLRVRGLEGFGWDPLQESQTLLLQTLSLANGPVDGNFRVRLLLLAYCHAIEMNFAYDMIANMIQISQGERYCMNWFDEEFTPIPFKRECAMYPREKIARIQEWAKRAQQDKINEFLPEILLKDVRNAFDHSDYVLYGDELRIIKVNERPKVYKLSELIPKLEFGINFVLMVIGLTKEGIFAYKENKIVPSRLETDPRMNMVLIADSHIGLWGFQSRPKQNN